MSDGDGNIVEEDFRDVGIPLITAEDRGNSLQENGLYFSLRYQPF